MLEEGEGRVGLQLFMIIFSSIRSWKGGLQPQIKKKWQFGNIFQPKGVVVTPSPF